MDEIVSDSSREVSSDSTHISLSWISCSTELSHSTDSVVTLDNETYDRTHSHVGDDLRIERLRCEVTIVLIKFCLSHVRHLHSDDLESTSFDTREDLTDKATVDSIWLEDDK